MDTNAKDLAAANASADFDAKARKRIGANLRKAHKALEAALKETREYAFDSKGIEAAYIALNNLAPFDR